VLEQQVLAARLERALLETVRRVVQQLAGGVQGLIEDREFLHLAEGDVIVASLGEKLEQLVEGGSFIGRFGRVAGERMAADGEGTAEHGAAEEGTTQERATALS
jgi:hypothetical protein